MDFAGHLHVIGATGTGKSHFLEQLIRKRFPEPFALVDWHGTLFDRVLSYLGSLEAARILVLDFSQPDFITPLEFFAGRGKDVSVLVARRVQFLLAPWATNANDTPTLERVAKALFTFAAESGETLPNAATMLRHENFHVREYALSHITNQEAKADIAELNQLSKREWNAATLSAVNRLSRFLGSEAARLFLGLRGISLADHIGRTTVLVNLRESDLLSPETARVFASLFLSELFGAAMRQHGNVYPVFLDEFQEYAGAELGKMLDQLHKTGIRFVLSHQHLSQGIDPHLKESLLTNCDHAVFGGLSYETASLLAQEILLDQVNERQIKATYYRTRERHIPTFDFVTSHSHTKGDDFESDTETSQDRPGYRIEEEEELAQEVDWSRDEKISQQAHRIKSLPDRCCLFKGRGAPTTLFRVPDLHPCLSSRFVAQYKAELLEAQGAIPRAEAHRQLIDSALEFSRRTSPDEPIGTGKRPKGRTPRR